MTNSPAMASYSSTHLVPITSKAPVQQSRFLHTKAKTKMITGAKQTTTKSTSATSKPKVVKPKPVDVLRKILSADASNSADSSAATPPETGSAALQTRGKTLTFTKPSEEDIAAYDLETVKAIRLNNIDQLRKLWSNGKSMDACNQFGESVLHMACRRGFGKIVEFLLREVKVRSDRCDDFGRNPFHDALWTSTPNFDVVDLLIDYADPALLLSEDVRGNTPFAYARSDHSERWISFLEKRRDVLVSKIQCRDGAATAAETKSQLVG
mmetsp:Transcript_23010/g.48985  ORF Transcript_23010/g.48985 Transcript_23010/m.48985 type:complete len:267 (-) Transcript_23010:334-1134(-)